MTNFLENNKYFILRHGEAISNKENFMSSYPEKTRNPLTENGKKQIQKTIPELKKKNINLIFSSDLLRTRQTAEIVAENLKLDINFDKRLRECNTGIFNSKLIKEWEGYFKNQDEKFKKRPPQGENREDIKKRVLDFIKNIDQKYKNKNILIISHEDPLFILSGVIKKFSDKEILKNAKELSLSTGELRELM